MKTSYDGFSRLNLFHFQNEIETFPFRPRHIQKVLTDVNAATGELFTSDALARKGEEEETMEEKIGDKDEKHDVKDKNDNNPTEKSEEVSFDVTSVFDEIDDSKLYFSPDQGNVVFAR